MLCQVDASCFCIQSKKLLGWCSPRHQLAPRAMCGLANISPRMMVSVSHWNVNEARNKCRTIRTELSKIFVNMPAVSAKYSPLMVFRQLSKMLIWSLFFTIYLIVILCLKKTYFGRNLRLERPSKDVWTAVIQNKLMQFLEFETTVSELSSEFGHFVELCL